MHTGISKQGKSIRKIINQPENINLNKKYLILNVAIKIYNTRGTLFVPHPPHYFIFLTEKEYKGGLIVIQATEYKMGEPPTASGR